MDDKTMLELAARAAGIKVRWHPESFYGPTMERMEGDEGGPPWNPLTDDGDALRLAVKLGIEIRWPHGAECVALCNGVFIVEPRLPQYSIGAATRRAIVRAAAEIGKGVGVG